MQDKVNMRNNMLKWLLYFILIFSGGNATANSLDSVEISLLTCSPGTAVYEQYGHTAIRCRFLKTNEDIVFNYGVFSFSEPHFIWRFIKGECDYQIGVESFEDFCWQYDRRGSTVYQQVVNLTPHEKEKLLNALFENMRPENRRYRYNFLYDNCTTRARDKIEKAIDGKVIYSQGRNKTYRKIIHQYTFDYPWTMLGIDICLGEDADKIITEREEMFAPLYMLKYADEAMIQSPDGTTRPFILSKSEIVKGRPVVPEKTFPLSPLQVVWIVFGLVGILTIVERRYGKCFWWLDAILLTLQGGIGLVVAMLFFFSVHPTVDSNWLIIVFNPIPLLAIPWVVYSAIRHQRNVYHFVASAVLTLFIIFSALMPQNFNAVVVPLVLILLLRSCNYVFIYLKR